MNANRLRRLGGAAALYLAAALALHWRMFSGEVLAGRDLFRLFIPQDSFLLDSLHSGVFPLWIPAIRLGQPFLARLHPQLFYPSQIPLLLAAGPFWTPTLQDCLHGVIGASGVYALARRCHRSWPAALLGGAAFAFSALLLQLSCELNIVMAAAWSGWIVLAADRVAREPSGRSTAILAGALALSLMAGSPETSLWQLVVALGWVWVRAPARRRALTCAALAALGAGGLCAVVFLPAAELTALSTRAAGTHRSLDWSVSWVQLLSTILPSADAPRNAEYWGPDQWLFPSCFIGSTWGLLGVAAMGNRRARPLAWAAAALALLALGAHFPPAGALLRLPPLSLFRYPAKYLLGAAFCGSLLATFGVDFLARRGGRVLRPALAVPALGVVAVALGSAHLWRPGAVGGGVWCLVWTLVALGAAHALRGRAGPRAAASALVLVSLCELAVASQALDGRAFVSAARLARPSPMARMLRDEGAGRLSVQLDDPPLVDAAAALARVEHSRDNLEPMAFVEDGLEALEGDAPPEPLRAEVFQGEGGKGALDLAGVTHYLRRGAAPFPGLVEESAPAGLPRVYRSHEAFPRAFLARRSVLVGDAAALAAVADPAQPARQTAFLSTGEALSSECAPGRVDFGPRDANHLELVADACAESYLVVAEAFFPGWRAEVDGQRVPIERADYALRAIKVPPGIHRVKLSYLPGSFLVGLGISLGSCVALLAAALWRRAPQRARAP